MCWKVLNTLQIHTYLIHIVICEAGIYLLSFINKETYKDSENINFSKSHC